MQALQQAITGLIESRARPLQQALEEVEVGENRREQLTVAVPVAVLNTLPVEEYLARLRGIKPHQQLRQGGFAAAVAARLTRGIFSIGENRRQTDKKLGDVDAVFREDGLDFRAAQPLQAPQVRIQHAG